MGASILNIEDADKTLQQGAGATIYLVSKDTGGGTHLREAFIAALPDKPSGDMSMIHVSEMYLYECLDVGSVIPLEGVTRAEEVPALSKSLSAWRQLFGTHNDCK